MELSLFTNNIEFIGFVFILTLFLLYKRKNLQVTGSFPFIYMMLYKTRLGLDTMKSWSEKHPNIFRYISYLSIFVGILGIFISFAFMIYQLGFILENNISSGGGLVLPIKTESGMDSAVPIFYVPFWYWILALFVLVVVHEFAHGVIAERWKVKVKSSGFAFLGIGVPIMPAAFVEPDEKSLETKPWWQKIAVFGAGSLSNFIFGSLFLLIWIFAAAPLVDSTMTVSTISFSSVMNQSGLNEYNISNGELISFDGVYNKEEILNQLLNLSPNQSIELSIRNNNLTNNYTVNTFAASNDVDKGMIGISGLNVDLIAKEEYSYLRKFPLYFEKLLFWFAFLNIGIGIMNLLPLWITDGGQIARTLLQKYLTEVKANIIFNIISVFTFILIIFTLWPSLMIDILNFL